jgi:hypothetical protein
MTTTPALKMNATNKLDATTHLPFVLLLTHVMKVLVILLKDAATLKLTVTMVTPVLLIPVTHPKRKFVNIKLSAATMTMPAPQILVFLPMDV